MSLRLVECDTDELDAMERHAKRTALGRGLMEQSNFQVVRVEGWAEFTPGPADHGGELIILNTGKRRYWILSQSLSDAMRTALTCREIGYRPDQLFNDGVGVQMVCHVVVPDHGVEIHTKAVNITARKGEGHNCIALDVNDIKNQSLYADLNEEIREEARSLAGHAN